MAIEEQSPTPDDKNSKRKPAGAPRVQKAPAAVQYFPRFDGAFLEAYSEKASARAIARCLAKGVGMPVFLTMATTAFNGLELLRAAEGDKGDDPVIQSRLCAWFSLVVGDHRAVLARKGIEVFPEKSVLSLLDLFTEDFGEARQVIIEQLARALTITSLQAREVPALKNLAKLPSSSQMTELDKAEILVMQLLSMTPREIYETTYLTCFDSTGGIPKDIGIVAKCLQMGHKGQISALLNALCLILDHFEGKFKAGWRSELPHPLRYTPDNLNFRLLNPLTSATLTNWHHNAD